MYVRGARTFRGELGVPHTPTRSPAPGALVLNFCGEGTGTIATDLETSTGTGHGRNAYIDVYSLDYSQTRCYSGASIGRAPGQRATKKTHLKQEARIEREEFAVTGGNKKLTKKERKRLEQDE